MLIILNTILYLGSASCQFPSIRQLDEQLVKIEHNEIAEQVALSRQREFYKYRETIIKDYIQKLNALSENPIMMIEYAALAKFSGTAESRLTNILVTDNHIFFYLISVDFHSKEAHSKWIQYKLNKNDLNEIIKRICKTKNIEGNCTTAKTNPIVYFFTIWDQGSYRILLTDLILRREFFNDHRGNDYFDSIEAVLELHYYIIETMQKSSQQLIKG